LEDAGCLTVLLDASPNRFDLLNGPLRRRFSRSFVSRRSPKWQSTVVECNQHGVGPGLVDPGIGRKGVLDRLIVFTGNHVKRNAMPGGGRNQGRNQEIHRRIAQYSQTKGNQWFQVSAGFAGALGNAGQSRELVLVEGKGSQTTQPIPKT
jgi:hypothetical protein